MVFNKGTMRYQNIDLNHAAVSAVTVSRLLRKRGALLLQSDPPLGVLSVSKPHNALF